MVTLKQIRFRNDKFIYHFEYDFRFEMNKGFARFSEFSESPSLRGTVFSLDEVLHITPDYLDIVLGHNIPSDALIKFMKVYTTNDVQHSRNKITNEEHQILKMIPKYRKPGDFYIIATCKETKGNFNAIDHEIAHAMYYLIPEYRRAVVTAMNYEQKRIGETYYKSMQDILTFKEYDSRVWEDEIHAFLVDLGLGSTGFFYGRDFKGFIRQLKAGKIRFHHKYKLIAEVLSSLYHYFYKNEQDVSGEKAGKTIN